MSKVYQRRHSVCSIHCTAFQNNSKCLYNATQEVCWADYIILSPRCITHPQNHLTVLTIRQSPMASSKLFTPIKVGKLTLQHRVVMAPLTRFRANVQHVPTELMTKHYAQRASTPGTLLIAEATIISPQAGGVPHAPGIYTDEQVVAWKRVSIQYDLRIIEC